MNPWVNSSHTTLYWILVSHHPDDVITICNCSPSDPDLSDMYSQPLEEELQHHGNHKNEMNMVINNDK